DHLFVAQKPTEELGPAEKGHVQLAASGDLRRALEIDRVAEHDRHVLLDSPARMANMNLDSLASKPLYFRSHGRVRARDPEPLLLQQASERTHSRTADADQEEALLPVQGVAKSEGSGDLGGFAQGRFLRILSGGSLDQPDDPFGGIGNVPIS